MLETRAHSVPKASAVKSSPAVAMPAALKKPQAMPKQTAASTAMMETAEVPVSARRLQCRVMERAAEILAEKISKERQS